MASIQKRGNGRWRARYRDHAGKEHARHFARKVDAQRWLDEVTAAVVTGQYADPRAGQVTFREWFDTWAGTQVWASSTAESARLAAAGVPFGSVPIRLVLPSHVQAWVKDLSTQVAASTVRTRFSWVHAAFAAAVKDRVIPTDPSDGVRLPKVRRSEHAMVVPTLEQVRAAVDAAEPWFRPFVQVCAFAGLRLGEAAALQLADVDFLRRTITVRRQVAGTAGALEITPPKAGSERVVYIPEALVDVLSVHVRDMGVWGSESWLFGLGRLMDRNAAGHQWRRTRDRAGLGSAFTLHTLRHFYASGLIAAGCDVVTVQRALGHAQPSITLNVYSHLWPTAEDRTRSAAADLMGAILAPAADSVRTDTR